MSINYPVDPDSRWAAYRVSTDEIIRHNKPWPRHDGAEIVNLDPDIVPLLEVYPDAPVFDPAIERIELAAPVVDVPNNTHTHGWTVIPLTQQELDDLAAEAQDAADYAAEIAQAKAVYLDLKNHVGTAGERATRMENVLAFMLKRQYQAEE